MADVTFVDDDQISIDGIEEAEATRPPRAYPQSDPDEFFSKHAFRVVYQTNNFLLPQLRDLITRGDVLNIRPEYQRRLRWTTSQKSRLIESLLLNIPVPPIFLYEADEARYEVMDGQQRLNAIKEFLEGDFALSGLEALSPYDAPEARAHPRGQPRIAKSHTDAGWRGDRSQERRTNRSCSRHRGSGGRPARRSVFGRSVWTIFL